MRLQQFMHHYFLVASCGEAWFDHENETALADLIEQNEDPNEWVWKYGGDSQYELTFRDIPPLLRGTINDNVQHWLQFIIDKHGHREDSTVCVQSMGCGSSDMLTIGAVREALNSVKENADG